MIEWSEKIDLFLQKGANPREIGHHRTIDSFANIADEYNAATKAGLCDRSHRTILEITGNDRASWLHNLTTNIVRELNVGDGIYSFAVNVKGRILFDMNILVDTDRILLDLDHRWISQATEHFNKYIITEDVRMTDWTDRSNRLTVTGENACGILENLANANLTAVAQLQICHMQIAGREVLLFKHDDIGIPACDLIIPRDGVSCVWDAIIAADATPVGYTAIDTLRIENGIPWPISEIHDDVLPAETGQCDRAVSYRKGCYLGQEIIERMRTRNVQAKKLVMIACDATPEKCVNAIIEFKGQPVGTVTSACASPARGKTIALGYVRAELAEVNRELTLGSCPVTILEPPNRPDH